MNNLENKKAYTDVNQNDFVKEVIEASKTILVIVDFWAPWCGPCKDLGPRLEKVVSANNDKIKLVKINIDENQELAGQLQIQSIPTVFAFKNGKIANAFQGSISEKDITKFAEKALGEKLNEDKSEIIKAARNLHNEGLYQESNDLIEEVLGSEQNKGEAIELLIKNNIGLEKLADAEEIINSLDSSVKNDSNIKSAISAYELASNVGQDSENSLLEKIEKDPLNIEINKKLSNLYFSKKKYSEAFSLIINLYSKSKKENKDEVKKILISYFDVLGPTHEKTKEARRKLSSMIFS